MAKYKNINGTANRTPSDGSGTWKSYYSRRKYWPTYCSCTNCTRVAEVGAHVMKVDSYDRRWFITPMCSYHNNQFGEIIDIDDSKTVPVNE